MTPMRIYLKSCSYTHFQRVDRLFYCSSNYFGNLFYPCRCRCFQWCRCCCRCRCRSCRCFCHSKSGWLVGTSHVSFIWQAASCICNCVFDVFRISASASIHIYVYIDVCVWQLQLLVAAWRILSSCCQSIMAKLHFAFSTDSRSFFVSTFVVVFVYKDVARGIISKFQAIFLEYNGSFEFFTMYCLNASYFITLYFY